MRRFFLISIGLGALGAAVVLVLYFLRVFEPAGTWLLQQFETRNFFPQPDSVNRLVWVEVAVIAALSLWSAWCLSDLPQLAQKVIVLLVFVAITFGISPTLALYGFFFEPFSSIAALVVGATTAIAFSGTELGTRKRKLEAVLGNRVSHSTFQELMEAPRPPAFEGGSREVTVLTCQLFEHNARASRLEPGDVLKMTNLFRRVTSGFLASHGAYLDESGPDEVRAFYGLLGDSRSHAEQAIRSALELRSCFRTLDEEFQTRWYVELECGVGLSSGKVTSGIYGSKEHFFLSGVGAPVDFSRRLARANRRYGSDLMIGPQTLRLVRDFAEVRPMEMFYDPESGRMIEIYQIIALREKFDEESRLLRDHFWKGMIKYREGNYREALDNFSRSRLPGRLDRPLNFFIQKTQEKMAGGADLDETLQELTEGGHSRLLEQL